MPEIEHATVHANGLNFHCARAGSGKLMLFLHGFPEFWRAWRRPLVMQSSPMSRWRGTG